MFELQIPGFKEIKIEYLVFDLNGTLTVDGAIDDEITFLVNMVSEIYGLKVYIATAATRGIPLNIAKKLNAEIKVVKANEAEEKVKFITELGSNRVCAIGNGANDVLMLKEAALSICVLGEEGAYPEAIYVSDIVVKSINDALKLFLHPKRLLATLRK